MTQSSCPKCKAQIPADAAECPECGAKLSAATDRDDEDIFAEFWSGDEDTKSATEAGGDAPDDAPIADVPEFDAAAAFEAADPFPAGAEEPTTPTFEPDAEKTIISQRPPTGPDPEDKFTFAEDEAAESRASGEPDPFADFETREHQAAEEEAVAADHAEPDWSSASEADADPDRPAAGVAADEDETTRSAAAGPAAFSVASAARSEPSAAGAARGGFGVLALALGVLFGLITGAGFGLGGYRLLAHIPDAKQKAEQINALQAEKGKLSQQIDEEKANGESGVKLLVGQLEDAKRELEASHKAATDAEAQATRVAGEKNDAVQGRVVAEQARERLQHEADGAVMLALNPEVLLGLAGPSLAAGLQAAPDVARLWNDYFARAEAAFTQAIQASPDRARLYALRAWARQMRGAPDADVAADVAKAVQLDANNQDAVVQFVASRAAEAAGDAKRAAERLSLAAQAGAAAGGTSALTPAAIVEHRGELLAAAAKVRAAGERQGPPDEALQLVERAIELEPKDASPADRVRLRLDRAELLLDRAADRDAEDAHDQAVPLLEAAAQSAAEAARIAQDAQLDSAMAALYTQGHALEMLGKFDDALAAFQAGAALAQDGPQKARFAAARARVRAARVRAAAPAKETRERRGTRRSPADAPASTAVALLVALQEELAAPRAAAAQEKPSAPEKAAQDTPRARSPELDQALGDAEQAIADSEGKSADAFYAKGVVLIAMGRYEPALEALTAGAALYRSSGDTPPELYLRAVADAYRHRPRTPDEHRAAELEAELTALRKQADSAAGQVAAAHEKLQAAGQKLAGTETRLAETEKKLAATEQHLANTQHTLEEERVTLRSEQGQHELWMTRYKGLMTETPESQQRESRKLYSRGVDRFFSGDYAAASDTLTEAIRLNPRDARYRYIRGLAYYRQNDPAAAENDLREAAALERQDAPRRREVNTALQRIQGGERRWLESFRPKNED